MFFENTLGFLRGTNNSFHRLRRTEGSLPHGFAFDPGEEWLKFMKCGEGTQLRAEEYKRKDANAKEMNRERSHRSGVNNRRQIEMSRRGCRGLPSAESALKKTLELG